ncbi:hypothetical protein HPP92_003641 [Vanilla planifolia]|uniref:STAS domain-containing protein n=1 Tax=Vanilla planifolia TaxID=51239 RepID=A0A835S3K6_VANPL|nr:hypothetical protein HPP92_003641 [Vanilla planifolia]
MLGLQSLFPILKWGSEYNFTKFKGDLIAGLTIASLCIPQDIGYSKLANLDPQYGLYSSFVPPLVYAVMGSSRDIAIGPVAVVSLLLGSLLQDEFDPKTNKEEYRRLAFTATFLQIGFSSGLSISCRNCWIHGWNSNHNRPSTAKGFLGIQNFTKKTDIISVMKSVWGSVHHGWNWETIVIGTAFLAFLMLAKYIDYQLDGNKEMVALGTMNIVGSMSSCYIATVFVNVEVGLLIAVSISFAKILLQVTRPRIALLGNLPQTSIYRNIQQYPEAIMIPGFVIVRIDSAIYFSISNYVKERILRTLRDEEEKLKGKQPSTN